MITNVIILVLLGIAAGGASGIAPDPAGECWAAMARTAIEGAAEEECAVSDQPLRIAGGVVVCPDPDAHLGVAGGLVEVGGVWRRQAMPGRASAAPPQWTAVDGWLLRGAAWREGPDGLQIEWAATTLGVVLAIVFWIAGTAMSVLLAWMGMALCWGTSWKRTRVLAIVVFGGLGLWFPMQGGWGLLGAQVTTVPPGQDVVRIESRLFGMTLATHEARAVAAWASSDFLWVLPEQDGIVGAPIPVAPLGESSPLPAALFAARQ